MNTEIESQVRDFLVRNILFVEEDGGLADDTSFIAAGVIDSIGIAELVEFVQRQFGLDVPLSDIVPANFDSITRLANYVRRRQGERMTPGPERHEVTDLRLQSLSVTDGNACVRSVPPAC